MGSYSSTLPKNFFKEKPVWTDQPQLALNRKTLHFLKFISVQQKHKWSDIPPVIEQASPVKRLGLRDRDFDHGKFLFGWPRAVQVFEMKRTSVRVGVAKLETIRELDTKQN